MRHTKGPWKVDKSFGILEVCSDSYGIAKIDDNCGKELANAQLIACAPELLEALEECLNHFNYAEERASREYAEEVQKLINKAKGGL
jgi:hypothetical protein